MYINIIVFKLLIGLKYLGRVDHMRERLKNDTGWMVFRWLVLVPQTYIAFKGGLEFYDKLWLPDRCFLTLKDLLLKPPSTEL